MLELTQRNKIERVIQCLTCDHLYAFGGMPFPYAIYDGLLFVASSLGEGDRTRLDVYNLDQFEAAYDAASVKAANDGKEWPEHMSDRHGVWSESVFDSLEPIETDGWYSLRCDIGARKYKTPYE